MMQGNKSFILTILILFILIRLIVSCISQRDLSDGKA